MSEDPEKEIDLDSDESDEDFCPEKVDSAESDVSESDEDDSDKELSDSGRKKQNQNGTKTQSRSKRKRLDKQPGVNYSKPEEVSNLRRTRQNGDVTGNGKMKCSLEKEDLESDEEEKSRTDALWADFLSDVKPNSQTLKVKAKEEETTNKFKSTLSSKNEKPQQEAVNSDTINSKEKVVTTEIFDFAGEEVKVEKSSSGESVSILENKKNQKASGSGLGLRNATLKRPESGAIGNILNQLGKKKKISVLEKTKLDWNTFKVTEGIQEDLQTFNKGKDGYLERQDFLQRTDLRQFEIEKNLRKLKRNNF